MSEMDDIYRSVFSTPNGQLVLADLRGRLNLEVNGNLVEVLKGGLYGDVPHPFRGYMALGAQRVLAHIDHMVDSDE